MRDIIEEYEQTKRILCALRTLNTDQVERKVIGGMISDCNYVLQWLRTGHRPDSRRGIERRAAYQRETPTDPYVMQNLLARSYSFEDGEETAGVSEKERKTVETLLSKLTSRERDCYEMAVGQGMSYREIAELMGIKKSSVQWFVASAKKKIGRYRGEEG